MVNKESNSFLRLLRRESIYGQSDTLARESDVTVSTYRTPYAEYKGFFLYVLSTVALVVWFIWGFFPDLFLEDYLRVTYLPSKYWSLAIPSFTLMLMLFLYIGVALYNTEVKNAPLNDVRNFVDEHLLSVGLLNPQKPKLENSCSYIWGSTSGVWDIPVTLANEVLYCNERDE